MSYNQRPHRGRGGKRYRDRDDYEDRRVETPEQKLKGLIIRFGEVDAMEELPRLAKQIREQPGLLSGIAHAFCTGVVEQPFKTPFYAALLRVLYEPDDSIEGSTTETPYGKQIVEELWKAFQSYLDKHAWRETRLFIQFFAHLTNATIISADSMLALLEAFTAVLEEFGVSQTRAKRAALCAVDGLLIAGQTLKKFSASRTINIIEMTQTYADTTAANKWLVHPAPAPFTESTGVFEGAYEILDISISVLRAYDAADFEGEAFLRPYSSQPDIDPTAVFDLPNVLVPPEVVEMEGDSTQGEEGAQIKKEEWPEWHLNLFDNTITADPSTPAGLVVKKAILDIVDIFEVNRKECARLLLEYPKWTRPGTFQPKAGAPAPTEEADDTPKLDWQLENTVIETILGAYFLLPQSSHKSIYYVTLVTELCKLSPSTVGPAVGKSIRKLYSYLAQGLDVEISRRFAEWFAVHMSNFNFQWVWKEWVPDLALSPEHPKRAFMRRAVEFEIRLAYHERIVKTLPEPMQSDTTVVAADAPGPDYKYDHPAHPYYEAAQSILNMFRGRTKAEDVVAHLDNLRTSIETADSDDGSANVDSAVRAIVMESLLQIGARSFSHLLNAIERYLPLLRTISSPASGSNAEAKTDILTSTASFWKLNPHMIGIVFDKLMQYQIVDPPDVIGWVFTHKANSRKLGINGLDWDILKGALDKANGRVAVSRRKLVVLRKEDDDRRARAKATDGTAMEVDADIKPDEPSADDNPALASAVKALVSLTREQKTTLSRALDGFVSSLAPSSSEPNANPCVRSILAEDAWESRDEWNADEWNAWETWGWYLHFCRAYAPYLSGYAQTLYSVSFSGFEHSTDPAVERLKRIWNISLGQDS